MPATRRFTPVNIVNEGCQRSVAETTIIVLVGEAANMTTFDYGTVGAGKACRNNGWRNHRWLQGACRSSIIKQGLPDCLVGAEKINASIPPKDTDTLELFMRAVVCNTLCHGHHGPVLSPGTFQHPAQWLDWVLEVSSLLLSFRHKPSRRAVCHSKDCMSFSTDCQRLPGKHKLPDVDKTVLLAWRGRAIVGSEKTTEINGMDAVVTKLEVPGLHPEKHGSWHMCGPN